MKTKVTELLGIRHPIFSAGMSYVSNPELVAAVSNAGGCGILAISGKSHEDVRQDVKKIKSLTNKPFGVNQTMNAPTVKDNMKVVIEEKVPLVNYALGKPYFIDDVHKYGGKVMATVATVRHGVKAASLGVDMVNVTGHEAGGHPDMVTIFVMLPILAKQVKVPITAAGGIGSGYGLAGALALGAHGVVMGTRFAMTKESTLHDKWKQAFLKATQDDTIFMPEGETLHHRVLRNETTEEEMKRLTKGEFPLKRIISGMFEGKKQMKLSWLQMAKAGFMSKKSEGGVGVMGQAHYGALANLKRAMEDGEDIPSGVSVGMIVGDCNDIPTCAEIIERTIKEAEAVFETMKAQFSA